MTNTLDLSEPLDSFLHNIQALNEAVPHWMLVAAKNWKRSMEAHSEFLEENGELVEEEGDAVKYRLHFRYIRKAERLSRKSDRSQVAFDLLPRTILVSFVSEYDAFLGKLIAELIRFVPEVLNSKEKNISFADLLGLGSIEAAREELISREVESVLRKSHSDQFDWFEKTFSIPLRKGLDSWPDFIELTERRNLFVHCDGVVSEQYLKVCDRHGVKFKDRPSVGDVLECDRDYLKRSYENLYEIAVKLVQVLWRKFQPDSIEKAEVNLTEVTYELLVEEKYRLAKKLLDFSCEVLKKWNSDVDRRIHIINRSLAYKFSGSQEKSLKILDAEDWSACGDNFQVCLCVLRDDFDGAKDVMIRIGSDGVVKEEFYMEWPVFKSFRESDQFDQAFNEVFGYSPQATREIDNSERDSSDDNSNNGEL